MISYQELKIRLESSAFRSRFKLDTASRRYALEKGPEQICFQAKQILRARLASAEPVNDGKQTPMRGHVVFIAHIIYYDVSSTHRRSNRKIL